MAKTNSKRRENKATGGLKYIKLPRLGAVALLKLVGEAASQAIHVVGRGQGVRRGAPSPSPFSC